MSSTRREVQELCDKLVANDPELSELILHDFSDDELKLVFEAAKKNATIKSLVVCPPGNVFSLLSMLRLLDAFVNHPTLEEIVFVGVTSFEEFSPVAVAFKQNDKLSRLEFDHCKITPQINSSLKWLLIENAIDSLIVLGSSYQEDEESVPVDLSGALCSNESLKRLDMDTCEVTHDTICEIPLLIQGNQGIKMIALNVQLYQDMARLIVQSAKFHDSLNSVTLQDITISDYIAEDLGCMLENAPALRVLDLSGCSITMVGFARLINGLRHDNANLEKLIISGMGLGEDAGDVLRMMLETNTKLKILGLRGNSIADTGATMIADGLRCNLTLEKLDMGYNNVGPEGTAAITDALESNRTLKKFLFAGNKIGDVGAIQVAEMLSANSTLEAIEANGEFGERGIEAFTANLPQMNSVKSIVFIVGKCGLTKRTSDEFIKALEQNMCLERVCFFPCSTDDARPHVDRIRPKMDHLLALNKAGRKILKSPSVSLSLWPLILGRSSSNMDALFFFLHEKADTLGRVTKTALGKRKHKDLD